METLPTVYQLPDVRDLLAGQLTQSSISMYRRDVRDYAAFAERECLPEWDAQTLITWRDHLATNTTMSPNTINRMLSAVRRVVKEAAARHHLAANIALEFANVPGVSMKALKERLKMHARTRITPVSMRELCEAPKVNTLVGKRDRALLATLASSGLRASELASLTVEQIEQQGTGYLLKVRGKTDIEWRDAHLSVEAKELIDAWLAARPFSSPYIFTGFSTRAQHVLEEPISTTAVWQIVQKYAKVCGFTYIKAHDFRRFLGTQLAAKDIRRAQKALGHKRIDTTAKHYVLDELEIGLTDHLY